MVKMDTSRGGWLMMMIRHRRGEGWEEEERRGGGRCSCWMKVRGDEGFFFWEEGEI